MTTTQNIITLRNELIAVGDELLVKYPGIPVLRPGSDPLIAHYDQLIAAILSGVPLESGTSENKRNDHRRRIDEYDDGEYVSAKLFTLHASSAELGQGLGQHRHLRTGNEGSGSKFVEGFRMLTSGGIIFVSQYTQVSVEKALAGPTTVHEIRPGDVVILGKNQAHTLFLNAGTFQGLLPTTFRADDLIPAKLEFS